MEWQIVIRLLPDFYCLPSHKGEQNWIKLILTSQRDFVSLTGSMVKGQTGK